VLPSLASTHALLKTLALAAATLALLAPQASHAGDYLSLTELGVKFYSGTKTPNMTGAYGFFVDLRAEKKKGIFRPQTAVELEYSMGTARFSDSNSPTFTMMSGSFLGGVNLFIFNDALFLPFVGANGILGWSVLKLTGQQAGVEANTEGLAYGYELSAGCDLRKSASAEGAVRVRTSYWQTTSTLAGAGFLLSGWRLSFGISF
jgi:hypothetical protein